MLYDLGGLFVCIEAGLRMSTIFGSAWYLCIAASRDACKGCSRTGVCACVGDATGAAFNRVGLDAC